MKRNSLPLVVLLMLAVSSNAPAQQRSESDEGSARIRRLEQWLSAIAAHRPGALDDSVRLVNTLSQEQLRLIWIDVATIVSLVRQPSVSLFFVNETNRTAGAGTPVSALATTRSRQVFYTVGELRRLREIAKTIAPTGDPGPENDVVKRGAMLHADIAILLPAGSGVSADVWRPGPVGLTLLMDDGQQLGLQGSVSHWNMGRLLLDRVRPVQSRKVNTVPDPGADDTVRLWYLAGCAFMARTRNYEPAHFTRALELFPDDPDLLFFVAAAHESFAGVRTQSVMQAMNVARRAEFGVTTEGAELRRAEQLYKQALEQSPSMVEARIRLGRVLGRRGRHDEAVEQLRQGVSAPEPLLRYYAHLFLGDEFEALGNVAEARRSYERAAALAPTAQSPIFGLSRLADRSGDRVAAREAVARVLALPPADADRADPWWVYEFVHARSVDRLLETLRKRF